MTSKEGLKNLAESNILLVKHLPSSLTPSEKTDLLKCFGATDVRVMPVVGKFKHCAFATFYNSKHADAALSRLHQLEILDCTLSVEYSAKKITHECTSDVVETLQNQKEKQDKKTERTDSNSVTSTLLKPCNCERKLPPVAPHFGLDYSADPGCKYLYPDPTADVLINISNALLTVPKFYTQVLHLMNKMNLLCPFSSATFLPPVLVEHFTHVLQFSNSAKPHMQDNVASKDMSESESELENDEIQEKNLNRLPPKRVASSMLKRKRNKLLNEPKRKLSRYMQLEQHTKVSKDNNANSVGDKKDISEVFNKPKNEAIKRQISLTVPPSIAAGNNPTLNSLENKTTVNVNPDNIADVDSSSQGFGKLAPLYKPINRKEIDEDQDYILTTDFITEKQLQSGKLSAKEMGTHPLFKKYSPGSPSCRLYIKNLSKKVTEKDLQHIFGGFVDFDNETEAKMFSVRVMQQGRMKGQAFVGLPSVKAATDALNLVNGYQLINKPMIVSYARSAKPKNTAETA